MDVDLIVSRHRGQLEWIAARWTTCHERGLGWRWTVGCDGDGRPVVIYEERECAADGKWSSVDLRAVPVLPHVTPDDVRGKRVCGVLPLSLAKHCVSVVEIELPGLRPDQRGKELTATEMDEAGAKFGDPLAVLPLSLCRQLGV